MKPLRVLVLVHEDLVPPDTLKGLADNEIAQWRTEFDVISTLKRIGHEVQVVGVWDDLGRIGRALDEFKPHIAFNLLEEFHGKSLYDQHVASYLELMRQPYTGCNPRGLLLSHDKALSKKILSFHRVKVPQFALVPYGFQARDLRRLQYPLIVKSLFEEGSFAISQASLVRSEEKLRERIEYVRDKLETPVIVEEFIEGRELYIPIMGNRRLRVLPILELEFGDIPQGSARIATSRVKWDGKYQERRKITIAPATDLDPVLRRRIVHLGKRIYRALNLTGYARIDLRLAPDNQAFVLEANANPDIAAEGEFAVAAAVAGIDYEALLQHLIGLGLSYAETPWLQ